MTFELVWVEHMFLHHDMSHTYGTNALYIVCAMRAARRALLLLLRDARPPRRVGASLSLAGSRRGRGRRGGAGRSAVVESHGVQFPVPPDRCHIRFIHGRGNVCNVTPSPYPPKECLVFPVVHAKHATRLFIELRTAGASSTYAHDTMPGLNTG